MERTRKIVVKPRRQRKEEVVVISYRTLLTGQGVRGGNKRTIKSGCLISVLAAKTCMDKI